MTMLLSPVAWYSVVDQLPCVVNEINFYSDHQDIIVYIRETRETAVFLGDARKFRELGTSAEAELQNRRTVPQG